MENNNEKVNTNNKNNVKIVFDENVKEVPILKMDSTTIIASKRNTGKSKLVLNLIYNFITNYDFKYVVLFSDTAKFLDDYKFMPQKLIFSLTNDKIEKIMKYQEQQIIKKKDCKCLMILDDVNIEAKSSFLNQVFTKGRHYGITIIMSVQFPRHVCSKIIRNNIDYLFISELNNETMKNIIKECICISGVDYDEIYNYIINNNNDYQFIMYSNVESNKSKRLSVIKAKLLELQMLKDKKKK
jgi:hypothetical protein